MWFQLVVVCIGGFNDFSAGLRLLCIPQLDGKMLSQVTMSWNSDIFIKVLDCFYGMEWQPHITRSLTVRMDCSMSPICLSASHMCRSADDKKS